MTDTRLKIGVVGAGWAGCQAMHAVQALPRTELVAISDVMPQLLEAAGQNYGCSRHYADYRELLADNDVDAVYLAVNPVLRHQMVLDSFAAGKHALVQKPHAVRAEQILEYESAAASAQKTLQFCYFLRHNPRNRIIRAAIDRGDIGDPYHARVFLKYNSKPAAEGITSWLQTYGQKGGALGQHASHELDLAWWWLGRPEPRWAFATKHILNPVYDGPEGPAEDYISGIIGLDGGKTLQIDCSRWLHADTPTSVEVYGHNGAIREGKISRFADDKYTSAEADTPLDIPHTDPPADQIFFYHEIEHFAMAVAGEVEPDVNATDAYQFMRLLDTIYDSAASSEKVYVQ
ncbi:MAG: Gfo/Idh/MocA family oxidoreductase [Candidatus Latescibacteria bacterium]|jgi:predicted dehydrogenase|nr:Gfo/Idh/MocA family oxidoreductase [Candidatus Latescibacterota bacterium]